MDNMNCEITFGQNRIPQRRLAVAFALLASILISPARSGQILFRDDFDSAASSEWMIPTLYSGYESEVVDGWLQWTPDSRVMMASIHGLPNDVSIRTRVRILDEPTSEVFVRITGRETLDPAIGSYYGGVTSRHRVGIGIGFQRILQQSFTLLDPVEHAVDLRLDIEGNQFMFWAWEAGTPMPTEPLWIERNSQIRSADQMTIGYNTLGSPSPPAVAWDFVEVRTIPEPAAISVFIVGMSALTAFRRKR